MDTGRYGKLVQRCTCDDSDDEYCSCGCEKEKTEPGKVSAMQADTKDKMKMNAAKEEQYCDCGCEENSAKMTSMMKDMRELKMQSPVVPEGSRLNTIYKSAMDVKVANSYKPKQGDRVYGSLLRHGPVSES